MPAMLRWVVTTPASMLVSTLLATTACYVPVAYAQGGIAPTPATQVPQGQGSTGPTNQGTQPPQGDGKVDSLEKMLDEAVKAKANQQKIDPGQQPNALSN